MLKAAKIAKHYENAANQTAFVMGPDWNSGVNSTDLICRRCYEKNCTYMHIEAVEKARQLGGAYIYLCHKGYVFWTSPFYSGERFAGSLISGGVRKSEENNDRVKSLAQLMLLCADKISSMSFVQKNAARIGNINTAYITDKQENYICTIDFERMLLASLRRGDNTEAQKILVKLLDTLFKNVKKNFPAFRLKSLELAVLLSRAAADPKDIIENTALDNTNRYLNKIEECTSFDDVANILSSIAERMSGKIFSFHGVRHFTALRKAERYIWTHYTRKLSLREIAKASGLSAPYFSTVFKEEMGENLSNYLNKLRIEKAAAMLITTNTPISAVATACGFEDQSWFSKIFKNNTGHTPGKYRELGVHAVGIAVEENIPG